MTDWNSTLTRKTRLQSKKPMNRGKGFKRKENRECEKTKERTLRPAKPRKPLPKKGKKKPWENEKLRREYVLANPVCEMVRIFPKTFGGCHMVPASVTSRHCVKVHRDTGSTDPHHVCRSLLGTRRWDINANLVAVCRPVHDFCHDIAPYEGMIISLEAKRRKGELDWKELNRITHMNLKEHIGNRPPKYEWLTEVWLDLIGAPQIP